MILIWHDNYFLCVTTHWIIINSIVIIRLDIHSQTGRDERRREKTCVFFWTLQSSLPFVMFDQRIQHETQTIRRLEICSEVIIIRASREEHFSLSSSHITLGSNENVFNVHIIWRATDRKRVRGRQIWEDEWTKQQSLKSGNWSKRNRWFECWVNSNFLFCNTHAAHHHLVSQQLDTQTPMTILIRVPLPENTWNSFYRNVLFGEKRGEYQSSSIRRVKVLIYDLFTADKNEMRREEKWRNSRHVRKKSFTQRVSSPYSPSDWPFPERSCRLDNNPLSSCNTFSSLLFLSPKDYGRINFNTKKDSKTSNLRRGPSFFLFLLKKCSLHLKMILLSPHHKLSSSHRTFKKSINIPDGDPNGDSDHLSWKLWETNTLWWYDVMVRKLYVGTGDNEKRGEIGVE